MAQENPPSLEEIEAARKQLGSHVRETPVWQWKSDRLREHVGTETDVYLKLELFQYTGTFKARGALMNCLGLDFEQKRKGVTAVSAGNHAMAVAFAARAVGTTAKVVMPSNANPARVAGCKSLGAEVILKEDVHQAFTEVERLREEEGRFFIHPFEGKLTILGTATTGLEFCRHVDNLEAAIIPIGGGGLCAGMATAIKYLQPHCQVYGVEPEGADTMHRSFASGEVETLDQVNTIADSLGAPHTAPYSLMLCRDNVDALVKVSDDELCQAMALLFSDMKLAVEPAGAAATAAMLGPLRERIRGKRVGIIVCGANIDPTTFSEQIARGTAQSSQG